MELSHVRQQLWKKEKIEYKAKLRKLIIIYTDVGLCILKINAYFLTFSLLWALGEL